MVAVKENNLSSNKSISKILPIESLVSRNEYLKDNLRNWIWKYRRENKDFPSFSDALLEANNIAVNIGCITQKGKEEDNKISGTTKSVLNWCKKNYKSSSENSHFANLIKKALKEERMADIYLRKCNGMKNKEIAEELGVSEVSVCNLLKQTSMYGFGDEDVVADAITSRLLFYLYCKENITPKIQEYIA